MGKKSSPAPTPQAPQPTFTPQAVEMKPIERTASEGAAARERASSNRTAQLLNETDDEVARNRSNMMG